MPEDTESCSEKPNHSEDEDDSTFFSAKSSFSDRFDDSLGEIDLQELNKQLSFLEEEEESD